MQTAQRRVGSTITQRRARGQPRADRDPSGSTRVRTRAFHPPWRDRPGRPSWAAARSAASSPQPWQHHQRRAYAVRPKARSVCREPSARGPGAPAPPPRNTSKTAWPAIASCEGVRCRRGDPPSVLSARLSAARAAAPPLARLGYGPGRVRRQNGALHSASQGIPSAARIARASATVPSRLSGASAELGDVEPEVGVDKRRVLYLQDHVRPRRRRSLTDNAVGSAVEQERDRHAFTDVGWERDFW